MNCKPGDLAIIIKTRPEYSHYLGLIVTVRKFHIWEGDGTKSWLVSPKLIALDGNEACVPDANLKPIRGQRDSMTKEEALKLLA